MRPKKRLLCVDSNEQDLSILTFMLETNGFRTIKATYVSEAINVLMRTPVELMIVSTAVRIDDAIATVKILKGICPFTPLILLCHAGDLGNKFHRADAAIARTCSSAELLERIKIITVRKPGPKKAHLRGLPYPEAVALAMGEASA